MEKENIQAIKRWMETSEKDEIQEVVQDLVKVWLEVVDKDEIVKNILAIVKTMKEEEVSFFFGDILKAYSYYEDIPEEVVQFYKYK